MRLRSADSRGLAECEMGRVRRGHEVVVTGTCPPRLKCREDRHVLGDPARVDALRLVPDYRDTATGHLASKKTRLLLQVIRERATGLEPATFSLEGWRSTN